MENTIFQFQMAESFISFNNLDKSSGSNLISSFQIWGIELFATNTRQTSSLPFQASHVYVIRVDGPHEAGAAWDQNFDNYPEIVEGTDATFSSLRPPSTIAEYLYLRLSDNRTNLAYYSSTPGTTVWHCCFICIPE